MISRICLPFFFILNIKSFVLCDHYYCNILRDDAITGEEIRWTPNQHGMSDETAISTFPYDDFWTPTRAMFFKFPRREVHYKICEKMKATPVIDYDAQGTRMEVGDAGVNWQGGRISIYRAAKMWDRWAGTNNHLHGVFCFLCRCNVLTPVPPASAQTLANIKSKLQGLTSQQFNTRQYFNTWDGGPGAARVNFANAPESQKKTTLGSETVQLRYFWTFAEGNTQSPIQWPLDSIDNMGECYKCPDGSISAPKPSG